MRRCMRRFTRLEKKKWVLRTLIYPVRDSILDLVLFPVVGHLYSFSIDIGFDENVVVCDVSLKNKTRSTDFDDFNYKLTCKKCT